MAIPTEPSNLVRSAVPLYHTVGRLSPYLAGAPGARLQKHPEAIGLFSRSGDLFISW